MRSSEQMSSDFMIRQTRKGYPVYDIGIDLRGNYT